MIFFWGNICLESEILTYPGFKLKKSPADTQKNKENRHQIGCYLLVFIAGSFTDSAIFNHQKRKVFRFVLSSGGKKFSSLSKRKKIIFLILKLITMSKQINILVTTSHRGVWFAQVAEDKDLSLKKSDVLTDLKNCRMAIYWGTDRGLHQLCKTGPTDKSKISDETDIISLPKITGIFSVTDAAAKIWMTWEKK